MRGDGRTWLQAADSIKQHAARTITALHVLHLSTRRPTAREALGDICVEFSCLLDDLSIHTEQLCAFGLEEAHQLWFDGLVEAEIDEYQRLCIAANENPAPSLDEVAKKDNGDED